MAENDNDITFKLRDKNTVSRLQRSGEVKVPAKKVSVPKDKAWNTKQMFSKLFHGIQNGHSIKKISDSFMETVNNNADSAVRNARTMVTSAECNGRLDSFIALAAKGVILKKVWIATPDSRTRESHLDADGEERDVMEKFSNGCLFPGDHNAPPEEVWNCRCSIRSHILGYRGKDGNVTYLQNDRDETSHAKQISAQRGAREKVAPDADGPLKNVKKHTNTTPAKVVKAVNPKFADGAREFNRNCANCVVASEARSRGYDVTAKARDFSRNSNIYKWFSGKDKQGSWTDCFHGLYPVHVPSTRKANSAQAVINKMLEYGNGARACIYIKWDGREDGHYFTVENRKGKIIFYDSQSGKIGTKVEEYFLRAKPSFIYIFRLDDKKITDFIRKVVDVNERD